MTKFKLINFPPVKKNENLDDFLIRCKGLDLSKIDLTINNGQPDYNLDTIHLIPYHITYDVRNKNRKIVKRRIGVPFAYIPYSNNEKKLVEGIIKSTINPEEKIKNHGIKCAKYCSQFGFETRLFVSQPLMDNNLELIYQTTFEEISKEEHIIFIPSLIYI
jgi:hypothetical protein